MNPKENTKRSAELDEELSRRADAERAALIRTWELIGKGATAPVADVPDLDAAWSDLQKRLDKAPADRTARADRRPRRSNASRRRRVFAGAVLVAAAAIALWMWQRPVTVVAPPGELRSVALADGSTIHLNSGTRLQHRPRTLPGAAAEHRIVALDGEAFFEIEPAEHTFRVETPNAVIEVLGTRFNVRARAERIAAGTEVTLASGRVRVSGRDAQARAVLLERPGDRVRFTDTQGEDSSLVSGDVNLDYVLAWRRKAFAAIDRPVGSIIAELERRYDLNIAVDSSVSLDDLMTLLYGPNTEAERILHDICLVQGCRYRPTTDGFAVFMPGSDSNPQ